MGRPIGLMGRPIGLMKRIAISVSAVVFAGSLVACVTPQASYNPYPVQGMSAREYNRIIAECDAWAIRQRGASPNRTTDSAFGGAALGALLGGIIGRDWSSAGWGALAGGGAGTVYGSQQAQSVYNTAREDCLRQNGL
ncbi:hypothetical protein COU59_03000 [Candidatus Pacearchaeota archaeon CG10_big_fil_rev_8_21_14_0_10_34_12]|nr:MAG: hypothetical protein COU59_03000 [Candidatus Pacearchaeota archaeon CG10_big_fil_rev_8_21_14_0_10_34_12]